MQKNNQSGLFEGKEEHLSNAPLAHSLRPEKLSDYIGIKKLFKKYPFLKGDRPGSFIVWGPPGTGKTTLAKALSHEVNYKLFEFSAVLSGVPELRKVIKEIQEEQSLYQRRSILFIDEIHRFNKAQQDALLPYVENGSFTFIGATTEKPGASINRALLSRIHVVELKSLDQSTLKQIIKRASEKLEIDIIEEESSLITSICAGDARKTLNALEMLTKLKEEDNYSVDTLKEILLKNARNYDKGEDRHYDVISAFIKSMRGSDPDAALLWLAVMLDGGEDPIFIARRLVIFASEDIGNADLGALTLANNALQVCQNIGMPEARITLAQATTYLASTVKSNAAYTAINEALEYVQNRNTIEVPNHLKNFPHSFEKTKYIYPHSQPGSFVDQEYAPKKTPQFYHPKESGVEIKILERLKKLWSNKKKY